MTAIADTFAKFAADCPWRIVADLPRRPANALNVEVGTPLPRCRMKPPEHWGDKAPGAARWLASGGSSLVFGPCSRNCGIGQRWCTCGHRKDSHFGRCHSHMCGCDGFLEAA
jgi:hypothetical protein